MFALTRIKEYFLSAADSSYLNSPKTYALEVLAANPAAQISKEELRKGIEKKGIKVNDTRFMFTMIDLENSGLVTDHIIYAKDNGYQRVGKEFKITDKGLEAIKAKMAPASPSPRHQSHPAP